MRVVRIQSRICVGGPALHSILLSEGLSYQAGSRYDTTLLGGALEPGEASMHDVAEARGIRIRTITEMRRAVHPVRDLSAIRQVFQILKKIKPHIVHTHTAKAGAIGRIAARMARVPLVLHTFHGHVFDGYFSKRKSQAFVQVERALAHSTNKILAISDKQREDLVFRYRIARPDKVKVVPLGLDLSTFRKLPGRAGVDGLVRKQLNISASDKVIVTVGRLVPIKRFDLLISAFQRIKEIEPHAHLVIVGDGECRTALETQAASNHKIHFLGLRRDLPAIYGDSDLMVLSSDNEGTPVAVIEALASGVPVVATDVGGVRDILRPGMGTIVPAGRVQELSEAIKKHLANLHPLEDALRDDVFARYSHRRLLADIERLYDELVDDRPVASGREGSQLLRLV